MAFYMPPPPTPIGKNSRAHAHMIQIGDSIKPASKTQYMVVEAVADLPSPTYPRRKFRLEDGSVYNCLAGEYIWWRKL
jgi:hypothetical protein